MKLGIRVFSSTSKLASVLSLDFSLVIITEYVLVVPSSAVTTILFSEGLSDNKLIFFTYTLLFPIDARFLPLAVAVKITLVISFGKVNVYLSYNGSKFGVSI